MKQKIIISIICIIVVAVGFSTMIPVQAKEHLEAADSLNVSVFGSSVLIGLRRVGCVITNPGENMLNDVNWMFTVKERDSDIILYYHDDYAETMGPELSIIFSVDLGNDFGLVEITATANCSQTGEVTDAKMMLHLGPFFIGPPFILSYI